MVVVLWFLQDEPFLRSLSGRTGGVGGNLNLGGLVVSQLSSVDLSSWLLWSNWLGPWSGSTFSVLGRERSWLEGLQLVDVQVLDDV